MWDEHRQFSIRGTIWKTNRTERWRKASHWMWNTLDVNAKVLLLSSLVWSTPSLPSPLSHLLPPHCLPPHICVMTLLFNGFSLFVSLEFDSVAFTSSLVSLTSLSQWSREQDGFLHLLRFPPLNLCSTQWFYYNFAIDFSVFFPHFDFSIISVDIGAEKRWSCCSLLC